LAIKTKIITITKITIIRASIIHSKIKTMDSTNNKIKDLTMEIMEGSISNNNSKIALETKVTIIITDIIMDLGTKEMGSIMAVMDFKVE